MDPLHQRAYGVKGGAEHLWSCSPFVGYVSVTRKILHVCGHLSLRGLVKYCYNP